MNSCAVDVGLASRPRGAARPNQDAVALPTQVDPACLAQYGCLYIVADGMGGHQGGEQASALAISTTLQGYYAQVGADRAEALRAAVAEANAAVYRQAQTPETEGMGSTLVAALILGKQLVVAHVGDSRAYLVRGGQAEALTRDHNWGTEVLPDIVAAEDISAHPYQRLLTRSIGTQPTVRTDVAHMTLAPGDCVVLVTDGVSGALADRDIASLVSASAPQAAADALVNLAAARGSDDDTTALVLALQGVAPSPLPSQPAATTRRSALTGVALAVLIFACLAASGWLAGRRPGEERARQVAISPPTAIQPDSVRATVVSPTVRPTTVARAPTATAQAPAGAARPVPQPSSVPVARLKGDVNGDGRLDIRDLARIGTAYGQEPAGDRAADVNGDDKVDIFDLVIVSSQMDAP